MKKKSKPAHAFKNNVFPKAWSGRFTQAPDPQAEAFASSLAVDSRLLPYDILASQAHVTMLARTGILPRPKVKRIQQGLKHIWQEWKKGKLLCLPQDEDVHMLVERRLHELIGPVAGQLHTARSRNDQVITDLKLFLRVEVENTISALQEVQRACLKVAEAHWNWIMPGYTHLQVAQPVLVSHWLLAHLEAFYRDETRLQHLRQTSLETLPLGAAALAGTSHPIKRDITAKLLGFKKITTNSMDTVADRDFALEFLAAAAFCGIHLSRLAEELVLFSSSEFGFLTIGQSFCTGSSIMPQKRNPDIAELLRARTGRLNGNLLTLLTVLKGLPLTYQRDLQEDKEPIFDSVTTLQAGLKILPPLLLSIHFNRQRLEAACHQGFPTATDAADHLVRQGVPFREAHAAVGRVVTYAAQFGWSLENLSLNTWRKFHPAFQPGIMAEVKLAHSIAARRSSGGTAPQQVRLALRAHSRRLYVKRSKR